MAACAGCLCGAVRIAIEGEPLTAYEVVPYVHGHDAVHAAAWLLAETLCYLRHLETIGAARRVPVPPTHPERWVAVVKPGRVLFELSYADPVVAREAIDRAIQKLPIKAKFVTRSEGF